MALDFDATARLSVPSLSFTAQPLTMSQWISKDSTGSNDRCCGVDRGDNTHRLEIRGTSSTGYKFNVAGGGAAENFANNGNGNGTGNLDFICARVDASKNIKFWVNGTAVTGTHSRTITTQTTAHPWGGGATSYANGRGNDFALWTTDLTDAEVDSLYAGYSPELIRPQSLICYVRMLGARILPVDVITGQTTTKQGTNDPTASAHPRIIYPEPVGWVPQVAVAGGTPGAASPAPVQLTLTVPAQTSSADVSLSTAPAPVALTLTVPVQTVVGDVSLATAPSPVAMTLTVPAQTAVGEISLTTSPLPVALTLTVPSHSAVGGGGATAPAPVELTLTVPSQASDYNFGVTTSPAPVELTLTVPSQSSDYDASLTTTPAPVEMVLTVPAQSAEGDTGGASAPDPVAMVLTVTEPTAVPGFAVSPDPVALVLTVPTASSVGGTVSGLVDIEFTGSPAAVIVLAGDTGD